MNPVTIVGIGNLCCLAALLCEYGRRSMFFPEAHVRIWLYTPPADIRKSFDGLSALVKNQNQEPSTLIRHE